MQNPDLLSRGPANVGEIKVPIMYSTQKTNKNFRIYRTGTNKNPIGYIKKKRNVYRLYCQKNKKDYGGGIGVYKEGVQVHIPGHAMSRSVIDFYNPSSIGIIQSNRNVRINAPGNVRKVVWAVYKLDPAKFGAGVFRLDVRHPYSWLQAFAFAVAVLRD